MNKRKFSNKKTSSSDVFNSYNGDYTQNGEYSRERSRCWITLVYPESCVDDWKNYLKDNYVPCFISPLHDKDVDVDGNLKKAHYHVLFCFENKKSFKQIQKIVRRIGGVGCFIGHSKKGYSRYLCHLDDADKHQYSTEEVETIGGLDYFRTIRNQMSKNEIIGEIMAYCDEQREYDFATLTRYAKRNRADWFDVIVNGGTYVIKSYLESVSLGFTIKKTEYGIKGVISSNETFRI